MKTSQIARGIVGALSLAGVMGMVGCGAQGFDEGAAGEGEIGSSEQAISISILDTPATDGVTYAAAKFPSVLNISSTKALIMGGYSGAGVASSVAATFLYTGGTDTGAWVLAKDGSNVTQTVTARGEAQLIAIPGVANKFYLIGGRSSEGGTILNTIDVVDITGGNVVISKAAGTLTSPRVNFTVQPCGSALLVSGGVTTGNTTVRTLEVITGGVTPVSAVLKDNAGSPNTIVMRSARAFHGALSFSSDLELRIAGGNNGAGSLTSTEKVKIVNGSACVMDSTATALDPDGVTVVPVAGNNLPASREKFVLAKLAFTPPSGTARDAILAAGASGATAPTQTIGYVFSSDTWATTNMPSLSAGHVYPSFALNSGNTELAIVGGLNAAQNAALTDVDLFAPASGTFSSPQDLDTARVGAWVSYIGTTAPNDEAVNQDGIFPVVGHGANAASSTFHAKPE